MLPEPPLPLPPAEAFLSPSHTSRRQLLSSPPLPMLQSLPANDVSMPPEVYKTRPNSFGLLRCYDKASLPSHDPEDRSDEESYDRVRQVPSRAESNIGSSAESDNSNRFYPYPNETSLRLGDWYWNQGSRKSKDNFKKLLSIIGNKDFRAEDVCDVRWAKIDKELGQMESGGVPEWLNGDAGWKTAPITITVPFPRRSLHPGPHEYTIPHFYHRSLVSIIREKVMDRTPRAAVFHYEPYQLLWNPPGRKNIKEFQVHGELYTSRAFLEAHRQLQDQAPQPGCDLPRRIVALMFWSDATQLTTFGETKLWPLYVYFGNETKYERCCPSSNLCAHAAYFQTVSNSVTVSRLQYLTFFCHHIATG